MSVVETRREYSVVWRVIGDRKDRRVVYRDKDEALRRVDAMLNDAFVRLRPGSEPRLETRTVGAWEPVDA